jgi:hypothetical protein
MKKLMASLVLVCGFALAFDCFAEQGGAGHYQSGQFADFSATVPTAPGWVFANYYLNYNNGNFGGGKELPLGGILAADATANYSAEVPVVMYAYPLDFLGGTLGSGVAIPYQWVTVKASAIFNNDQTPKSTVKSQSTSGLGDIQLIPVMAGWTNGDFKFDAMMNIWAPTGDYTKGDLANTGLGYWTFTPMVAVSWLSTKIGTEASLFTGVDFNTKNTEADYQSGNIFHVDATVAQHLPLFGGIAGAGATAFWLRQISNDSGSGARLGGFMANSYGIGPTISYIYPVGKSMLIFDGSWLPQTHTDNTTQGNFFWAKLTLMF